MTTPLLDCVELTTGHGQPRHAVIWLHGLGADGHDFAGIVPELNLPDDLPVRFVFPHAPMIPVTINHGYLLRAWYDILHADGVERTVDQAGIHASRQQIEALIAREAARGVPFDRMAVFLHAPRDYTAHLEEALRRVGACTFCGATRDVPAHSQ